MGTTKFARTPPQKGERASRMFRCSTVKEIAEPGRQSVLAFLFFFWVGLSSAVAQESISYVVETSQIQNHVLTVTATFPPSAFATEQRELALPVWTPGSYKVRDYSRFLSAVKPLNPGTTIRKTAKNRWLVEGSAPEEPVKVSYDVYGHELTVRTNYFTPELSLVVGAATFLAPSPLQSDQMRNLPYTVEFQTAQPVYSALEKQEGRFVASDYVELVDCPILLGDLVSHSFSAGGRPHSLVQAGDPRYWDVKKSLDDTTALIETIQDFWGDVPYGHYLIMNLITDTRGGLEHRNSTVVMTKRFATKDRKSYLGWLSLISHEFFHTWNVKRLRPATLRPFNFENETYTRSLWIAEGITSYYDDLMVRRAGLSTRKEYLEALSLQLNRLKQTPGRNNITLSDASFDAWIRLYQPTDDLHNSNISYYNKGAVVAWLLDTEIRIRTRGKKSLDDLMRLAYRTFEEEGFEEAEFRRLASTVAGSDLTEFFDRTLDSTEQLDLSGALEYWNLSWKPKKDTSEPYLGIDVSDGPRVTIEKVFQNSPAANAGLAPGDEVISFDGVRLPASSPLSFLKHHETGKGHKILVSRLGSIQEKTVILAQPPHPDKELGLKEKNKTSVSRWNSWMGLERESDS
jgi:predicted metalloprotease with PDZ domain